MGSVSRQGCAGQCPNKLRTSSPNILVGGNARIISFRKACLGAETLMGGMSRSNGLPFAGYPQTGDRSEGPYYATRGGPITGIKIRKIIGCVLPIFEK